jgi:hypothetical protein
MIFWGKSIKDRPEDINGMRLISFMDTFPPNPIEFDVATKKFEAIVNIISF